MALMLASIHEEIGNEVALTDWVEVDQMQINIFGEVTRWTPKGHTDPEWAEENSPYGGTIVHGFFMISLITHFLEIGGLRYPDGTNSLNYGMDKARILQPVMIGDGVKLRDRISILSVEDKGDGKRLIKSGHQIESDKSEKPAAYVEYLNFWHPKSVR